MRRLRLVGHPTSRLRLSATGWRATGVRLLLFGASCAALLSVAGCDGLGPLIEPAADDHGDTRASATAVDPDAAATSGAALRGSLESSTDVDYFSLEVPAAGTLVAWTTGDTRTAGQVLDGSGTALRVADEGASDGNFRVLAEVGAGVHYIRVGGRMESTGRYLLHVRYYRDSDFNIELRYLGPTPDPARQQAVEEAAVFWMSALVRDLPNVEVRAAVRCTGDAPLLAAGTEIDDVVIFIEWADDLDGPGGTVAQAGVCQVREAGNLPTVAIISLDTQDTDEMEHHEFRAVVLHEMAHALGFGVIWRGLGFLEEPSITGPKPVAGKDTHFDGPNAVVEFDRVGGDRYDGRRVPVENDTARYGRGALDKHWRESVFGSEMMTPTLEIGGHNPVSRVTIASFEDLGYEVDYAVADRFTLPGGAAGALGDPPATLDLGDDVWRGPVQVVDAAGNVVGVIEPE